MVALDSFRLIMTFIKGSNNYFHTKMAYDTRRHFSAYFFHYIGNKTKLGFCQKYIFSHASDVFLQVAHDMFQFKFDRTTTKTLGGNIRAVDEVNR